MSQVIDFFAIKHAQKQRKEIELLDKAASVTALEICLDVININNLKELEPVKSAIYTALNQLNKKTVDAQKKDQ